MQSKNMTAHTFNSETFFVTWFVSTSIIIIIMIIQIKPNQKHKKEKSILN